MVFPDNYHVQEFRGKPKGMEQILRERGLWDKKCALQELIEVAGHVCIFYPKFHCELNFIERYWGASKRYARENCDYSWSGLQRIVPISLESVDLITIRKFARHAWRYMDLYKKGITGKLAEYGVKKYKSHRRIPDVDYFPHC